jgi:glucose/arabinose dehydrogenase
LARDVLAHAPMRRRSLTFVCLLVCLVAASAQAQLRPVTYVTGLSLPIAFVQDPGDPAVQYVVQQGGLIRTIVNGALRSTPFLDLRSATVGGGEQGLLGMALPPDYASSGRVFVDFTDLHGDTVVARFTRSPGNPLVADASSRVDLRWSTGERVIRQPFPNHNGGTLQFGPDGYLYVGMGDGGSGNDPNHNAQNMASLLGKMLRLDVSVPDSDPAGFRVPPDNPFVGRGAPEIWDIGLRNPWKYSFDDPALGGTGALVIGDVGQNVWEEVDYEPPARGGNNYGWRNREGGHDNVTSLPPAFTPLVDPILEYPHPTGNCVTGGYVYRGSALGGAFRGRYFFADFVAAKIWSVALTVDPDTGRATASDLREHTAELTPGNVSAFGVDAAGELYFLDYSNGAVVRIAAASPPQMSIDVPVAGGTVTEPFAISGWVLDPRVTSGVGIATVHVWAVPLSAPGGAQAGAPLFVGAAATTIDRPDVAALFGSAQFTRCGFAVLGSGLPAGAYRLMVFALVSSTGTFDVVRTVDLTIVSHMFISVDTPQPRAAVGGTIDIGGWALDGSAPSGTGVDAIHVWAASVTSPGPPLFLGATTTFFDRADVGALFGAHFATSGFGLAVAAPPPGVWDLYVFARSMATGQFESAPPVRVTR